MTKQYESLLKWFNNSPEAIEAFELLEASIAQGCWIPKASRRVRAVLTKPKAAVKMLKNEMKDDPKAAFNEETNSRWGLRRFGSTDQYRNNRWHIDYVIRYGVYDSIVMIDFSEIEKDPIIKNKQFIIDFLTGIKPVNDAMNLLDSTRPKPTFTFLGVSPTITKTLTELGLDLNTTTVRAPEIEFRKYSYLDENGDTKYDWTAVILWPKNTVFGSSRFHHGHNQCESCGHRISNAFNWFPILIDDKNNTPHAFWVGSDCAQNLFGVKMTGKLNIEKQ